MPDTTYDIDALLQFLSLASRQPSAMIMRGFAAKSHAALTALVAERDALKERVAEVSLNKGWEQEAASDIDRLRAELAAAIKQRDNYRSALERIANQDYRGNRSTESQIAFSALAEMRKEGGGA